MGWESSDVVRFDLRPLFQGQTRRVPIPCLLLVLEVFNGKLTYRKTWAGNFLMCSDFDLGPLLQCQLIAKFKSAYNLLIIGPKGLQCEPNV